MSKTFTLPPLADIVAKIREIASKRPDFVYQSRAGADGSGPTCFYVEEDVDGDLVPSCLIGHAFIELGVTPELLQFDRYSDQGIITLLEMAGHYFGGLSVDNNAAWLERVQNMQDNGYSWGKAVADADAKWGVESDI